MGYTNLSQAEPQVPYALSAARGEISGVSVVHKFGHAPDGIQTTLTDFWPRADSVPTQQIWVAPTQARIHAIVSTSTDDDGDPAGVGAQTVKIWGLTSWSTVEVSETVTLDGTTPANTANSYVIINRMAVTASGATNINVGEITATAATDGTITALIVAGAGQTEQAVLGIASVNNLYITRIAVTIASATASHRVDSLLKVCSQPTTQPAIFTSKHRVHVVNSGTSAFPVVWDPPFKVSGPAIVKMSGIASTTDVDGSIHFEGYLDLV